jgi:hypothetical protein
MRALHTTSWFTALCFSAACCAASAQTVPLIKPAQLLPYPTDVAPPNSGGKYGFGCGVALDGNRMLVSAADTATYPARPASLFFYAKDSSGKWSYAKRITPRSGGSFHCTLALKGDTAVIAGEEAGVGVVYVLRNTSGTTWNLTQVIQKQAADLQLGPDFLAIGNWEHAANRGIVYFYKLVSPAKYSYLQTERGADYGMNFGMLDASGPNTVLVGQSANDGDLEKEFIYRKTGDVWSVQVSYPPNSYGWRVLGSAAYQPGYWAIERTELKLAEVFHEENGAWKFTQVVTGDCDATKDTGTLIGPLVMGGNRLVYRSADTNTVCMSELHNGTFVDTAILDNRYTSWPTPIVSGNTILLVGSSSADPSSSTFNGVVAVFNLPAVVN